MAGTMVISFGWACGLAAALLHVVLVLFVVFHCLRAPREPRSSLLWIAITCAFPVIGFLFYLAVGINRMPAKRWRKKKSDEVLWNFLLPVPANGEIMQPSAYWREIARAPRPVLRDSYSLTLNQVLDQLGMHDSLLGGNTVQALPDGTNAYPAMLHAIEQARHHIHLQSYIIAPDDAGRKLMELLARRAREGIRVRVLYDSYGSARARWRGFFRAYASVPNMSVVGFSQANILRRQMQINLRNHRKLLVVDGASAFLGGLNISDGNLGIGGIRGAIHDFHFKVTGPSVLDLQYTFLRDWYYMTEEDPEIILGAPYFPSPVLAGDVPMRVLNAGPTDVEALGDVFFNLICGAKKEILIVTPYFIPTEDLRSALRSAALRGVDVRILVPKRGNNWLAQYAARSFFEELLVSGVRIFERFPPFMHTKLIVADGRIVVLGSANFDTRSIRLNYETSMLVCDAKFGERMKALLHADLIQSTEVRLSDWRLRSTACRFRENFCALFSPVL